MIFLQEHLARRPLYTSSLWYTLGKFWYTLGCAIHPVDKHCTILSALLSFSCEMIINLRAIKKLVVFSNISLPYSLPAVLQPKVFNRGRQPISMGYETLRPLQHRKETLGQALLPENIVGNTTFNTYTFHINSIPAPKCEVGKLWLFVVLFT